MVISNMTLQGDSLGLLCAYYVKDLECHNMLYLAYGYELRPYESSVEYYVYIYIPMW